VIFSAVESLKKPHLVISSTGTSKLELLQRHPRWKYARDYFVFPSQLEQRKMHELIYDVKLNRNLREAAEVVQMMMARHGVNSFVAACSEIHLLAKQFEPSSTRQRYYGCTDPLTIIAQHVAEQNKHEA
jgi:aspartate racemase